MTGVAIGAARRTAVAALTLCMTACASNGSSGSAPAQVAADADAHDGTAAADRTLLVSGRITQHGVVLEPALLIAAPASLPDAPGGHRLLGLDAAGSSVFDVAFEGVAVADASGPAGEEHFTFAIPLSPADAARLHTIELRAADGRRTARTAALTAADVTALLEPADAVTAERLADGRVRIRWDGVRFPLVLVRDPATGGVLGFGRAGEAVLAADATSLDVILSEGVRSGRVRVLVR
jgi:hypothetical protein